MATEGGSIEGREEEEIYQVEYLGYHLDSNLSAEFLAMKVLKKSLKLTFLYRKKQIINT